jgi:hypothetical protein
VSGRPVVVEFETSNELDDDALADLVLDAYQAGWDASQERRG